MEKWFALVLIAIVVDWGHAAAAEPEPLIKCLAKGRWMTQRDCDAPKVSQTICFYEGREMRGADCAAFEARRRAEERADPAARARNIKADEEGHRRTREQAAQDEARAEVAKKKRCGKDYMALRVGMRFERLEQCFETLAYVTDTVSAGGTVETWRSNFYLLHFSNGVMVGYTRRAR